MNPPIIDPDFILQLTVLGLLAGGPGGPKRPAWPHALIHFAKPVAMMLALFGMGAWMSMMISWSIHLVLPILAAGLVAGMVWGTLTYSGEPPSSTNPPGSPAAMPDQSRDQADSTPRVPPAGQTSSPDGPLLGFSTGVTGAFVLVNFLSLLLHELNPDPAMNAYPFSAGPRYGTMMAGGATLVVSWLVFGLLIQSERTRNLAWGVLCGGTVWGSLWLVIAQ